MKNSLPMVVAFFSGALLSIAMTWSYDDIINGGVLHTYYPQLYWFMFVTHFGFIFGYGGILIFPPFWFIWGGGIFYAISTKLLINVSKDEMVKEIFKKKLYKVIIFIGVFPFAYFILILLIFLILMMFAGLS